MSSIFWPLRRTELAAKLMVRGRSAAKSSSHDEVNQILGSIQAAHVLRELSDTQVGSFSASNLTFYHATAGSGRGRSDSFFVVSDGHLSTEMKPFHIASIGNETK